jgi:hypothetical protein
VSEEDLGEGQEISSHTQIYLLLISCKTGIKNGYEAASENSKYNL